MVSRFHFQNKVLNIDGVKVKLQVRIYVHSHQQLNVSDTMTPQPQLQPKISVSFPCSSLWLNVQAEDCIHCFETQNTSVLLHDDNNFN